MRLLDIIFPVTSLTGEEGCVITKGERERIETRLRPVLITKPLLMKRGILHLDALVAAGSYRAHPLLKTLIWKLKYQRVRELTHVLSEWILQGMFALLTSPKSTDLKPILCPVPLHWTRQYLRGFNQSTLIAEDIGKAKGWTVEHLLMRTRRTGFQSHRKRAQRLMAMTEAFEGFKKDSPPPWVILVDDLATTGATLDACARELKRSGVKHVTALVAFQEE